MKMINRTKVTLSVLLSGIIVIIFFVSFDFTNLFIFPLAELIMEYSVIICIIMTILAVFGIAYRNKITYFNSYKRYVCIIGYIFALSTCITIEQRPICSLHVIILCSCEILLIFLLSFDNLVNDEKSKNKHQNPLQPINECDKLFNSRKNQIDIFVNLVLSDTSNYGYAICINGEWGTGKTSFINSAIDQMKKQKISYEEIRINSMELDNFETLANYFFNCIKSILKKNDVYVGIDSEYKELVSSLVGTVIHETAGGFINRSFSSDLNYRNNLHKLSNLLEEHLKNTKILIIVDDLERCGKKDSNSGLNYLFFIKEIAMLNRCICVFLINYNEFLKTYETNETFLDKFFNRRINLMIPSENEIFGNVMSSNSYIEEQYNLCKKTFEEHINECYKQSKSEEKYINSAIEQYNILIRTFKNPRKAGLFLEKIQELDGLINLVESNYKKKKYQDFINKVNFRYQIFLLSYLYVAYPQEYDKIESNGFMAYIDEFLSLKDIDRHNRNWLIKNEWCDTDPKNADKYILNEKYRFIHYLLCCPKELPNIANGFTSLQEQHFSYLLKKQKPNNVLLSELLVELLSVNTDNSDKEIIKKYSLCLNNAFSLYDSDLTFDQIIHCLESRTLVFHIAAKKYFFDIIIDNISKLNIVNVQESLKSFREFAKIYIQYKTSDVTMYLILCANTLDDSITTIGESVLVADNCEKMIMYYCNESVQRLKLQSQSVSNPFDYLYILLEKVDEVCKKYDIYDRKDVSELRKNAREAVVCFKKLCDIESLITNSFQSQLNRNVDENDRCSELIEEIQKKLDNNSNTHSLKDIAGLLNELFNAIYRSDEPVTEDDLEQISRIIEQYNIKTKSPTAIYRYH